MRKMTMALVILLSLGLAATAAWSYGPGGCPGWGAGNDGPPAVSEENQAALDKFQAETSDLRRELVTKKSEYQALMNSEKPDPKRAGELAGQIFDLQEQMRAKAKAAGLPAFGPGMGPGPGAGYGNCPGGGPGRGRCGRGGDNDGPGRW
ncbi:MAG: periplasmic heavy metal sensor [Proteobacteria bacterium]|nr:periplasmic heavy metal sensor [Pseudomonadota bacterium]